MVPSIIINIDRDWLQGRGFLSEGVEEGVILSVSPGQLFILYTSRIEETGRTTLVHRRHSFWRWILLMIRVGDDIILCDVAYRLCFLVFCLFQAQWRGQVNRFVSLFRPDILNVLWLVLIVFAILSFWLFRRKQGRKWWSLISQR